VVEIYIGNTKVDQYKDEAVTVVSSVLDVSDIAKNTGDYSKTFSVPASKSNNLLFKHWYNANIDNGFDARTKVEGRIEIDGIPFKIGKFRLYKVNVKKGVAVSYTVNFFGNLVDVSETLGKDKIASLDLTAYDHDYNSYNVALGLQDGLFNKDIIYSLQTGKRYFYNSNANVGDFDENQINIAYNGSGTGVLWDDINPSLKLIRIIEAIEAKYSAGTIQVDTINITSGAGSLGGNAVLIINNIQYSIPVTSVGGSLTNAATQINTYINTNVTGFTSTVANTLITITADEVGNVGTTIFNANSALFFDGTVTSVVVGTRSYENPIVFSRDFFGTSEFENLYMWLKPDANTPAGGFPQIIDWDSGDFTFMNEFTNIGAYETSNTSASDDDINFIINLTITPVSGFEDVPYTVIWYNGSEEYLVEDNVDGVNLTQSFISSDAATIWNLSFAIKSINEFQYTSELYQFRVDTGGPNTTAYTYGSASTTQSIFSVSQQIPDIEIIDLLKGLFNMYKLVVIPQDDGTLYVNTLQSYYDQGERYDVTKYIDNEKNEVQRGEILNEIDIKFQESETILAEQFRSTNNRGFGDSLVRLEDENGKLLDGDSLEMELPFEQFVYERLQDQNDGEITNVVTATVADETIKPVDTAPNIHYVSLPNLGSRDIAFVDNLGARSIWNAPINVPSHASTLTSALHSTLFEAEFSNWDGAQITNTLYKNHYENYIKAIFNIKRRTFTYRAVLPVNIVTKLELNDVIRIGSNDYRINKYGYNILNGATVLELINGFDNILGTGFLIPKSIVLNTDAQSLKYNVPNAKLGYTITLTDLGFGTNWVTVNTTGDVVMINVTQSFETIRNVNIVFTGTEVYTVFLSQFGSPSITFDNNITTFDNTNITWDSK
jgi:hypothetical protein